MSGRELRDKDILRAFRGNTRKVAKRISIELCILIVAWMVLIWLSNLKYVWRSTFEVDDWHGLEWIIGLAVLFLWAFTRLIAITIGPCVLCQGAYHKESDLPCAECSMRVEMPSRFERYEPHTFKEKVLWVGLDYIPKASRAKWKDGRWER